MSPRRLLLLALVAAAPGPVSFAADDTPFRRGDANGDGFVNMVDAYFIYDYVLSGGAAPPCMAAADANADGMVVGGAGATDIVVILSHLYRGGEDGETRIASPFPDCGLQNADQAHLGCENYTEELCENPPGEATLPPLKALYGFSFEAPPAVTVGDAAVLTDVFVNLRVPNDAVGIGGWSVRVRTSGGSSCRVHEATLDGTDVLDQFDDRSAFFSSTLSDGNKIVEAGVVLSFASPKSLAFHESSASILKLVVLSKSAVASSPCTLEFVDPDPITTDSIFNLLSSTEDLHVDGRVVRAIRPATEELTFQVCSTLPLDEPTRLTLDDPDAGRIFCFRSADPNKAVLITVTPTKVEGVEGDGSGANGLYFQWGAPPTRTRFAASAEVRGQADQRLVLAESRDEVGYVLVRGTDFSRDPRGVTVTVSEVEFALEGMTARRFGVTPGNLQSAIFGAGFVPGTTFTLEPVGGGTAIEPAENGVVLLSDHTAHVTFEIPSPTPGLFDLVATDPAGSTTTRLPDEFEIVDSDQPGFLEIEVISPDLFRADTWRVLIIRFRNGGYQQIEAPILHVEGPASTTYRLPGGEEQEDSVDFIGIHAGGVAGVLAPGAVGKIALLFRTEDRGDDDGYVHFDVSTLAPKRRDLINWDAERERLDLSLETIEQLKATLGTRWLDYARNLAALSSEMAREGNETASLDDVFYYAVSLVSEETPAAVLRPTSELATLRATRTLRVVASLDPNDKRGPTGSDGDPLDDPHCVVDADRTVKLNCGLQKFFYTINFENLADQQTGGDTCPGGTAAALEVVIDDALDVVTPSNPDGAFDLSTLRFHEVSFGEEEQTFESPSPPYSSSPYFSASSAPGVSHGYLEIDMEPPPDLPERQWFVSVEATVDVDGTALWEFVTRDRLAAGYDDGVSSDCDGFLPSGGKGFVSFSVSLSEGALRSEKKTIKNTASIVFDTNEAIETCPWENEVSEAYCLLAATVSFPTDGAEVDAIPPFALVWNGQGLGVEYSVFFSKTGEESELAVEGLTDTGWSPGPLDAGTSYTWKVRSMVGGTVADSVEWEFTTTTEFCDDGEDNDGDGDIDCADADCAGETACVGPFIRGDCDGNGTVGGTPTEAIVGLKHTFRGGPAPPCLAACDAEANGTLGITDYVRILRFSFAGGAPPDAPFPACVASGLGGDVALGCETPFCPP